MSDELCAYCENAIAEEDEIYCKQCAEIVAKLLEDPDDNWSGVD